LFLLFVIFISFTICHTLLFVSRLATRVVNCACILGCGHTFVASCSLQISVDG